MDATPSSRWLVACASAFALSGCAAALIPVAAGGAMMGREVVSEEPAETVAVVAAVPAAAPSPEPAVAAMPQPMAAANAQMIGGSYAPFARHALAAAGLPVSVLPDPDWNWDTQYTQACADPAPAVLIDLDPETAAFDPVTAKLVAPGLGRALSILREREIAVIWASRLPQSREAVVRAALARTGLDPAGEDLVLLTQAPGQTKTERRNEALGAHCVVAIAGDTQSDFDMLFDHLRAREDMTPFASLMGRGWFFAPPPMENTKE